MILKRMMLLDEFRERVNSQGIGNHYVVEERGGIVEALHRVHVAIVDVQGKIRFRSGDPHHYTFSRSCIKPIQALPFLISGACERYEITDEELALICGSHSGEEKHIEVVRSILNKGGIDETALQCGIHPPFHKATAESLSGKFLPVHNNCSGKHASILILSKMRGWPVDTYRSLGHPAQREIIRTISEVGKIPKKEIGIGWDGCGVPNFAMPIDRLAFLFAQLGNPKSSCYPAYLEKIRWAMMRYPYMISGTGRFDLQLTKDFGGEVIPKAGAQGLQSLSVRVGDEWYGIAAKIEDGSYDMVTTLVYSLLRELGLGSIQENEYSKPIKKNRLGESVGSICVLGSLKGADGPY